MHILIPAAVLLLLAAAVYAGLPDSPRIARFALVSDTHTNRGTEGDQARYRERLDRVITAVNAADVDAVLVAGDLTESGAAEQMADFREQARKFHAPVLSVPGNHDVGDKHRPGREGGVTEKRVTLYEQAIGPSFFVDVRAGVRIIGLNAALPGSGLSREADQWAFLEQELARPAALPTLLLLHYPPFLKSPDEPGDPYWNIEPEPRARLLALFRRGGVRAVLSGHLHRPLDLRHAGILYATTPPVAFGLPPEKQAEGWSLVTVTSKGEVRTEFQPIER